MLTGDSYQPSRDQWHRQCNVLALPAAATSIEYSSSANPLNTEKLRHKRMLLALHYLLILGFSVPPILKAPLILWAPYTFNIRGVPSLLGVSQISISVEG